MKKFYQIISIFLFGCFAFGQDASVGINTENPKATLHIKEIPLKDLPEGQVQGVIFPHFSTEQRATFTNVKLGTMIYNTTLNCLEIYTKVSGVDDWYCLGNNMNSNSPSTPKTSTKIVQLEDILPKQKLMFQDEEGNKIYNSAERGFFMHSMLNIFLVNENTIRVKNFLPHNFKNVKVYYQTDNLQKAVNIITFEEIPAFADFEEQFSFAGNKLIFEDEDGNQVEVNKSDLERDDYYIPFTRSEDPVFKKLETIKHQTFAIFYDYGPNTNWAKMTPRYAREYLPVIANMAYLYSSEKFKQAFMNYEHRLYDDKGLDIDRQKVYEKFFTIGRLAIGVVNAAEGLATLVGNSRQEHQFGVHHRFFDNKAYYQPKNGHPRNTWAHEYGHVLGFNHSSNMTYKSGGINDGYGYVDVVVKLYQEMLESGELPFSKYPYQD